jgi:hypothetical protein
MALVHWMSVPARLTLARATRPRVAQMVLDFLSAPGQFVISNCLYKNLISVPLLASSVDAERSFSCGRLQINHLQYNIGSQSFKALMALGSWLQTPLLSIDHVTNVIRDGKSRNNAKGISRVVDNSDIIIVDP